ncbi:hypothetical protein FDC22_05995 [Clostridium botulinum]|uniref:XkdX family protein n=1 Tax=Clostridium botulinum (strain Okra / Type B1) TaxID=498213 RepID=B1IJ06_CLOBK|nr:hypothetical protein [Clostridium botulinum]ACA45837.1 hypothetical protein CLD_2073 [Clostridium botulinum B1 str. Okra]MBD5572409.1 hypothetical protein [Clostridium botulinum]MBD5581378.1 hypothetical protein [Clostridium botulinum]MBD5591759.1 hypothetical protein [Clostridium botulinum]MBD5622581.1 hypothetical protein [Clostridium botulinum]
MLYEILKSLIGKNAFEKEDMTNKLNVFYTFSQLTVEQYAELMGEVSPNTKEDVKDNTEKVVTQ